MKKYIKYNWIILVTLFIVSGLSCKKKTEADSYANIQGKYFSIRQFAVDEWNTFHGEPFVIIKTIRANGKTDSSFTNSDTVSWSSIFRTFFATDISDRKFLGQYTYSQFPDNLDGTMNLFYQANDEDLFTQKLLITIDNQSGYVTGIYVETLQHTFLDDITQKLYYSPMKTIQIQTDDKPKFGSKKFSVLQYDFMR